MPRRIGLFGADMRAFPTTAPRSGVDCMREEARRGQHTADTARLPLPTMFKLRHRSDLRTLGFLAAMVASLLALWFWGFRDPAPGETTAFADLNWSLVGWLLPLLCFLGVTDAVISHNHNHVPIFEDKWSNIFIGCVISLFYGYPCFAWIPTHNMNHHHFNNKPGDHSITTRPFRKVGLLAVATYPTVTSITQMRLLKPFLARCWKQNRFIFWRALVEYAVFYGVMIALFWIDWRKALLFALIPQQVALFVIQHFNYLQHIETDSYSDYNHSRNFTGWLLNILLFNNGFHTVHHEKPDPGGAPRNRAFDGTPPVPEELLGLLDAPLPLAAQVRGKDPARRPHARDPRRLARGAGRRPGELRRLPRDTGAGIAVVI
jgi:fatty acid desaturase